MEERSCILQHKRTWTLDRGCVVSMRVYPDTLLLQIWPRWSVWLWGKKSYCSWSESCDSWSQGPSPPQRLTLLHCVLSPLLPSLPSLLPSSSFLSCHQFKHYEPGWNIGNQISTQENGNESQLKTNKQTKTTNRINWDTVAVTTSSSVLPGGKTVPSLS